MAFSEFHIVCVSENDRELRLLVILYSFNEQEVFQKCDLLWKIVGSSKRFSFVNLLNERGFDGD